MVAQSLLDEVTDQASAAAIEHQTHKLALADFPNQIAEQRARVEQAMSALDRAQLDLDHATLHAPFGGPVLSVAASPGNHTALGQPLVEIADADGLEVRAPVPDVYSAAVRRHLANGVPVTARTGSDEGACTFVLTRLAGNVRDGHSGIDSFFRIGAPATGALEIGRVLKLSITLPDGTGRGCITRAVDLRERPRVSGGRRPVAGADGRTRRRSRDRRGGIPDSGARRGTAPGCADHHHAIAEGHQRTESATGPLIGKTRLRRTTRCFSTGARRGDCGSCAGSR
jgi:hypothetical protein